MKKYIASFLLIVHIFTSVCAASVFAEKEEKNEEIKYVPHADHMLVCDVESGFKIYSKDSNITINPYGYTKILTAITVIENKKDLTKKITVPRDILKDYDYSNGNIGLTSGEKISAKDLIYAMIMQDAGDCALALAHTTFKTYDEFIKEMNSIAKKAGAENSQFTEPAGFPGSSQKTTLEDMQKITTYALKNDIFCEIAKTQRHEISPTNLCNLPRIMFTTNRFLSRFYSEDYFNSNISGVKGYYKDASDTGLIIRYSNGSDDLLILTAKSDEADGTNYAYEDTLHLIEKGRGFFTGIRYIKKEEFVSEIPINTGKDTDRLLIVAMDDIRLKLPKEYKADLITREVILRENIDAPLEKFEELGIIKIFYDGFEVGSAPVAAYNKIEKSTSKLIKSIIIDTLASARFWIIVFIIFVLSALIKKINSKKKHVKKL